MRKTFRTTDNKGFQITFPNGLTLSTQFGPGNYGDNYDSPFLFGEKALRFYESNKVEIAIFDEDGKWKTKEFKDDGDDVLGHLNFNEWLKAFEWCQKWGKSESA